MEICKSKIDNAYDLAVMHKEEIAFGFLSSIGVKFLKLLYKHLITHEITFVAIEGNEIVGFISCSKNTKKLYKRFFINNIFRAIPVLITNVFSKRFIKGVIENFLSLFKKKVSENKILPELLSIAVKTKYRNNGIASLLIKKLEEELLKEKYNEYCVIAGNELLEANSFYKKHGFLLNKKIRIHGKTDSNLYIKKLI